MASGYSRAYTARLGSHMRWMINEIGNPRPNIWISRAGTNGIGVTDAGVVKALSGNTTKPMKKRMMPSTGPPIHA